jgi:hypothetical protein
VSSPGAQRLTAALAVTAVGAGLLAALLIPSGGRADAAVDAERMADLQSTAEALRDQLRRERVIHERVLGRARRDQAPSTPSEAIRLAAAAYGQSEERLRGVAECESHLDPAAVNGQYLGLYQFGEPLWNRTPFRDFPRSHPYAAALAAGWAFSRGLSSHWPICGRR